jgi:hypothetical protein
MKRAMPVLAVIATRSPTMPMAGVDRTVANTTPVWHAGRLLMTKEDGRPIDRPITLETRGR